MGVLRSDGSSETLINEIVTASLQDNIIAVAISIGMALVFLFLWKFFIVAPRKLYETERTRANDLESKLDNLRGEESKSTFDMSASDAAQYIMERLGKDIAQANEFVKQLACEGRLRIRAIRYGESVDRPIDSDVFESNEIFLVGTEIQRQHNQHFDCAYDNEGWIVANSTAELNDSPAFIAPRFITDEIREVVRWYRTSRPDNLKE